VTVIQIGTYKPFPAVFVNIFYGSGEISLLPVNIAN